MEKHRLLTDFVYEPYKTVKVRDVVKMSLDDLVNLVSTLESSNAYWADGALFVSFVMTESEELAKKEIQGETYLDRIMFTKYEKYTKTVKSSENIVINILNVQTSGIYRDLVSWLKQQPIWKD